MGLSRPRVLEWGAIAFSEINRWDLIKLKIFYTAKETIDKMKRQPTEQERIFANTMTNKGLIANVYNIQHI